MFSHTKQELYDIFVEDAGKCYAGQSFSASYFYRTWATHRPNLKPKRGGTFMKCNTCTLFQDTLNGSPGKRTTLDTATIARVKQQQSEHVKVRGYDYYRLNCCSALAFRLEFEIEATNSLIPPLCSYATAGRESRSRIPGAGRTQSAPGESRLHPTEVCLNPSRRCESDRVCTTYVQPSDPWHGQVSAPPAPRVAHWRYLSSFMVSIGTTHVVCADAATTYQSSRHSFFSMPISCAL